MSNDEQVWEEYLSRRPNLSRWIHGLEQDGFLDRRVTILKDEVMNGEETEYGKKVADLDDGEALAYFEHPTTYNNLLVDSKAIKHFQQPSINLDEAGYATQGFPYIHLLCARELGGAFTSPESVSNMDFIDDLLQTINDYRIHKFHHIVWDTEQDLVKTVVRYKDYRSLFKVYTDSDILIDNDFLNDYLLVTKPDPIEIDKNTWHGMSVKFIEKLDGESDRVRTGHMNFLEFVSTGLVSCFLNRNIEKLTFMESVYDFCVSAYDFCVSAYLGSPHTKRILTRDGMLDPKIFDMFREYGAEFAKPLLENALMVEG